MKVSIGCSSLKLRFAFLVNRAAVFKTKVASAQLNYYHVVFTMSWCESSNKLRKLRLVTYY